MINFLKILGLLDGQAEEILKQANINFYNGEDGLYILLSFKNTVKREALNIFGIEEVYAYPIGLDDSMIVIKAKLADMKYTYEQYINYSLEQMEDIQIKIKSILENKDTLDSSDTMLIYQLNNSYKVYIDNLKFAKLRIDLLESNDRWEDRTPVDNNLAELFI